VVSRTCEGRFWDVFGTVLEGAVGGTHSDLDVDGAVPYAFRLAAA
jgi:hypothetical protein